ncbi:hypothetical protein Dsin_001103 [Dipteronia sinensis]|uniref:Pentatricopeptide repeat-containing protein n=1 Tax=Dipteronia sinensis TaxID=43782 RepID=A0AAE0EIP1_9ROSI|nr:hypothetical protein Dsin_001103 [Dipteronia sinensis]
MRCQLRKIWVPVNNLHGKKRLKKCTSLLRDCLLLNEGKLVHGHVIRSGLQPDSHFWVSLVHFYAKCRSTLYARRLLDVMPEPVPCLKKYSLLLSVCAAKGSIKEPKIVHGHVIVTGLEPDTHLWASMVNSYVKCGSIVCAHKVFDVMPVRDVVSWTALISGYVDQGHAGAGVSLLCRMQREEVRPNEFALATGLKACSMCMDLDFGKQVHTEVIKLGFCLDLFVGSALVDLYAKCGEVEFADRVFRCMPETNVVLWNAMLNGYSEMGYSEKFMNLFYDMKDAEIKFSKFTLVTVLKGCANSGYIRAGQVVHSLAIRLSLVLDEFVSCTLLDMYSKCGLAAEAIKIFKTIKDPDVVTWSTIVTCLEQQGQNREAAKLFNLMRYAGVTPNQFTLASLVSAVTDIGDLHYSESIHACICKYGFESDGVVGNALVTMYMQNGYLLDGARIFETMIDQDLVSWNAFLSGFQDHVTNDIGPKIFYQMLLKGFKPNAYTFDSILRSCSSLSDVAFGKQVHANIIKYSLAGNNFVGTTLVYMYAKTGCLEDAYVAFNILIARDVVAWTAIIAGFAQADQAEETLKCFRKMQQEGLRPNEFTFASCVSSCSNVASLESGRLLHSMAVKSGHLLDKFVSTSLVDMYGKCRCIEDSEAVFRGSVLRDTVSWNAMIGVYVQHGEREKALEAYRTMFDEDVVPDDITFIVLSAWV